MKNLFLFFALLILISCDQSDTVQSTTNVDRSVEFSVFDSQNEDLLNPENPNSLNVSNIKLFYYINGEKQYFNDANLIESKGYRIYKHEKEYRIWVNLNDKELGDKAITYIEWKANDVDTIEATFERTGQSFLKNKIWLNGSQVWERGNNTVDAYFILTK